MNFRIATYNVHRCRGLDRRVLPRRIAEVLRPLQADVIALQEVLGAGPKGHGHDQELGAALGMGWVMGSTRLVRGRFYGNVVMSRFPIDHHTQYDLTWKTRTPRGCQRVDIQLGRHTLHIYNVHLGVGLRERQYQAKAVGQLHRPGRHPWTKGGPRRFQRVGAWIRNDRTDPSVEEHGPADFSEATSNLSGTVPHSSFRSYFLRWTRRSDQRANPTHRRSLIASDHLPLVADIRVDSRAT